MKRGSNNYHVRRQPQ